MRSTAKSAGLIPYYQLKVTLVGSRPPIWRRLKVSGNLHLGRLHQVLQIAMGWEDVHLHLFAVGRTVYSPPDPELGFPQQNERKVLLREVLTREKERLRYEYDFGDGWEHSIVVEKILPPEPGGGAPVCLAGKRSCPPEDCGGIFGYEQLLEALRDPSHPDHRDLASWVGEDFDPEAFDLKAVNSALARLR
ncbi:MAG TPA: plasmid pRiA4b ORF-3 family protein [Thermoanaerobaculia bacterium]|nr:plasmid pRiA4b ORF-3 family protein [Thermoanaerobaculia bacterium]